MALKQNTYLDFKLGNVLSRSQNCNATLVYSAFSLTEFLLFFKDTGDVLRAQVSAK